MIEEIVFLKSRKEQIETLIRDRKDSLYELEEELKFLNDKIDNTVVDGLRMRVREFIETGRQLHNSSITLKRLEHLKWTKSDGDVLRKPYLDLRYSNLGYPCNAEIGLTEEEALLLSSEDGRQAYNIDCSVWDTYRYPGEID